MSIREILRGYLLGDNNQYIDIPFELIDNISMNDIFIIMHLIEAKRCYLEDKSKPRAEIFTNPMRSYTIGTKDFCEPLSKSYNEYFKNIIVTIISADAPLQIKYDPKVITNENIVLFFIVQQVYMKTNKQIIINPPINWELFYPTARDLKMKSYLFVKDIAYKLAIQKDKYARTHDIIMSSMINIKSANKK